MPLLLVPSPIAAAAPVGFSRPPPARVRASHHLLFAFPRLRKYGRRDREPAASTGFDEEEEVGEEDEEEEVDEDEWLENSPKPVGFGVGKTYSTDIEEQLLREMGLSGAAPVKHGTAEQTGADVTNDGVHVRVWNLPKKKNIQKDLNLAFKGFPGLIAINPVVSANKKTRDPICKGSAYLKLESVETATRFVEIYSRKSVSFGKVEKPIKCCIVDRHSSADPSNQSSNTQAIRQPGLKLQNLVAAS